MAPPPARGTQPHWPPRAARSRRAGARAGARTQGRIRAPGLRGARAAEGRANPSVASACGPPHRGSPALCAQASTTWTMKSRGSWSSIARRFGTSLRSKSLRGKTSAWELRVSSLKKVPLQIFFTWCFLT